MDRLRTIGPKDQGKRDLWLIGLLTVPLIVAGFVWGVLAGGFAEPQPTPTPSQPVSTPAASPQASPAAFFTFDGM